MRNNCSAMYDTEHSLSLVQLFVGKKRLESINTGMLVIGLAAVV